MSNYGWTNADGEPIMDGAAYRFEQQLDADTAHERMYDDEAYNLYGDEPEYKDPEDCDHSQGWDGKGRYTVECVECLTQGIRVVDRHVLDENTGFWSTEENPDIVDVIVWFD